MLAQDSTDIHITAVASYGNTLLAGYYMDPLTLYTNFTPPDLEQEIFGPQPNSPFEFLQEVPVEIAIGQPGIYLFSFGDASEQAKIILQAGAVMTISPLNGTLFSGASGLDAGWQFDPAPGDLKAYTFRHLIF